MTGESWVAVPDARAAIRGGPVPIRSRALQLAVAAVVATVVAGLGLTSAAAVGTVGSGCAGISGTRGDAASTRAAIAQLTHCLRGLEKRSEAAGHAAQLSDERYLQAKAAAKSAADAFARARGRAEAAAVRAQKSRTQAGVVAMQVVRGAGSDQAGTMILDDRGAARTLYSLSRISQLAAASHGIRQRAEQDSAEATHLTAQAAVQSSRRRQAAAAAGAAFATARDRSNAAGALVRSQRSRVRHLQAQLASLQAPSGGTPSRGSQGVATSKLPPNASLAARAVAFARSQIGDPYVFAAAGPGSWDCSGLTLGAYASVGVAIGIHSATAQYNYARSRGRLVSYADRQPGDLVFYTDGGGDMYHVAMYSGNGMMIEAPTEGLDVREVPVRTGHMVGQVARPTA
jgi:peptidoglycan DL-endopeptidase CwlO